MFKLINFISYNKNYEYRLIDFNTGKCTIRKFQPSFIDVYKNKVSINPDYIKKIKIILEIEGE